MNEVLAAKPINTDTIRKIEEIGVTLDRSLVGTSEDSCDSKKNWPRYRYYERPNGCGKL